MIAALSAAALAAAPPGPDARTTSEPALVDALVDDTPKQDALPLLAFALQTVWRQYGDVAVLTKSHYENVGGLRELLEDAAERALRGI